MLEFPCSCGHAFSLPDEAAGTQVQCPQCRRLVDVPTQAELSTMDSTGTYVLRAREIILPADAPGARPAPRYDPETGELIRPHPLRPPRRPVVQAAQAVAAEPVTLRYASGSTPRPERPLYEPALELFMPSNAMVMVLALVSYLFALAMFFLVVHGVYLMLAPLAVVGMLLLGHGAVVIDEIGPGEHDALPRPLRDVDWHDDLGQPLLQMVTALGLCYGLSALALLLRGPILVRWGAAGVLAVPGTILFPAALLTTATSGTVVNLRPDRLWQVMCTWGVHSYIADTLGWMAAAGCIGLGAPMAMEGFVPGVGAIRGHEDLVQVMGVGLVAVHCYLMHLWCWRMGLVYRRHAGQFGWVLQKHERGGPLPPSAS